MCDHVAVTHQHQTLPKLWGIFWDGFGKQGWTIFGNLCWNNFTRIPKILSGVLYEHGIIIWKDFRTHTKDSRCDVGWCRDGGPASNSSKAVRNILGWPREAAENIFRKSLWILEIPPNFRGNLQKVPVCVQMDVVPQGVMFPRALGGTSGGSSLCPDGCGSSGDDVPSSFGGTIRKTLKDYEFLYKWIVLDQHPSWVGPEVPGPSFGNDQSFRPKDGFLSISVRALLNKPLRERRGFVKLQMYYVFKYLPVSGRLFTTYCNWFVF